MVEEAKNAPVYLEVTLTVHGTPVSSKVFIPQAEWAEHEFKHDREMELAGALHQAASAVLLVVHDKGLVADK